MLVWTSAIGRKDHCVGTLVASFLESSSTPCINQDFMHRTRSQARFPKPCSAMAPSLLMLLAAMACDSNPYDAAQQPSVTVAQQNGVAQVVISWQPEGAQLVRVYRGATAGDGYSDDLMWSIAATGKNSLRSGVTYAATSIVGGTTDVAARPLLAGRTYTVEVTRADPRGKGDGFTNTSNRYVGTATFLGTVPLN